MSDTGGGTVIRYSVRIKTQETIQLIGQISLTQINISGLNSKWKTPKKNPLSQFCFIFRDLKQWNKIEWGHYNILSPLN